MGNLDRSLTEIRKEKTGKARRKEIQQSAKSDMEGNYDIDGVSYSDETIYVGSDAPDKEPVRKGKKLTKSKATH